jgi:hypothetical protein
LFAYKNYSHDLFLWKIGLSLEEVKVTQDDYIVIKTEAEEESDPVTPTYSSGKIHHCQCLLFHG